jgi:hypothetical protein
MKPLSIGRTLGIGLRIAGRMASQRVAAHEQTAANPATLPPRATLNREAARAAGRTAGTTSRGVARGLGGFIRPFRRIGGILWLEVTGVFFFLPVLVFTPTLWRTRPAHLHGPYDRTFIVCAVVIVIFFYLGVTSFLRARKR